QQYQLEQHGRQHDALLPQPAHRERVGQEGADRRPGAEGQGRWRPPRDRAAAEAAEGHHRRPGALAGQPARDAADGRGVPPLPEEVRRPGGADRDVPRQDQGAAGRRVRAPQGLRGLPRQTRRRVSPYEPEASATVLPSLTLPARYDINRPITLTISATS